MPYDEKPSNPDPQPQCIEGQIHQIPPIRTVINPYLASFLKQGHPPN